MLNSFSTDAFSLPYSYSVTTLCLHRPAHTFLVRLFERTLSPLDISMLFPFRDISLESHVL